MKPDDMIKRRAKKIVDSGALSPNSLPLATLTETIIVNDNLEALTEAIKSIPSVVIPESVEISNLQEYPSEMAISNLPEVQRVEVTNFPKQENPVVNVKAPVVNVEAPNVVIDNKGVETEIAKITEILSQEKEQLIEQTEIVDEEGKVVNFKELFEGISLGSRGGGIARNSLNSTGGLINPSTEEKQDSIITAIEAIPIGLTDSQLRASPVPVDIGAASVTINASDIEIGAVEIKNSTTDDRVSVINSSPTTEYGLVVRNIPSGTQDVSISTLPAGTNNIGDVDVLTLPNTSILATAVDATTSGDNTIVSITNIPRLYYISLSANGANSADVTAIVKIGASTKYKVSLKAGAIWSRNIGAGRSYVTGSAGDDIIVNLSAVQTVHVSVEYSDS